MYEYKRHGGCCVDNKIQQSSHACRSDENETFGGRQADDEDASVTILNFHPRPQNQRKRLLMMTKGAAEKKEGTVKGAAPVAATTMTIHQRSSSIPIEQIMCKKEACAIQYCFNQHNFSEDKCRSVIDAWQKCATNAKKRKQLQQEGREKVNGDRKIIY